jgi:hypothetical protein
MMIFHDACRNGNTDIIEWILPKVKENTLRTQDELESAPIKGLEIACRHQHFEVVKLIQKFYNLNVTDLQEGLINVDSVGPFQIAAFKGNLEMVKWFVETFKIKKPENYLLICSAFGGACLSGSLEVAKWIHKTFRITRLQDIEGSFFPIFRRNCKQGHFEIVQWIQSTFNLTPETIDRKIKENVLIETCCNGKLEVAQWLHKTLKCQFKLNLVGKTWFREICENGHVDVADWVRKTFYVVSCLEFVEYSLLFDKICKTGHLKMAKWLTKTYGILSNMQRPFVLACKNGHLKTAQWIYAKTKSRGGLTPLICSQIFFQNVCLKGNLSVIQWLVETFKLDSEFIQADNNLVLRAAKLNNNSNVVNFLAEFQ